MSDALLQYVDQKTMKDADKVPAYGIGDTVDVHYRIVEGTKERIQVFGGVVIAASGGGVNETITVRRIVANEGVERIFPIHSPKVAKIEVKRSGHTRRSKLYYLRERVGKSRRLKDRRRGLDKAVAPAPQAETTEAAAAAAE